MQHANEKIRSSPPHLDSKRSVFNGADQLKYAEKKAAKNRCVAPNDVLRAPLLRQCQARNQ